jgi:hypothetical protein
VKANQKTLHRQILSQFQGKRHVPFVATDHEISHGRTITWTLRAKQAPEHIREAWIGTSWIVEVAATGSRDGKPFQARHLFLTSLRTTPEALLKLVRDRWSNCFAEACRLRGVALDPRHPAPRRCPPLPRQWRRRDGNTANRSHEPAEAGWFSSDSSRDAGGDARHHGTADAGTATAAAQPVLRL